MKPVIGALVLAGVLGLAACTSAPKQATKGTTLEQESTTTAPATTEAPTTTAAPEASHRVGVPFVYDDGLQVAATYLGPQPISATGAGGNRARDTDVVFRVTITAGNTSMDPTLASVSLNYSAAGNQAEQVYDSEKGINGIEGPPKLLPHHRTNGLFGFAVPRGQVRQLVLTVTPDFDREPVVFER